MSSPLTGLKNHLPLKLFALSGLTSSPTLVEIPPGQPLLGRGEGAEAASLGRRERRGVALFVDSDLLPPQTPRKAQSHWGPQGHSSQGPV